MLDCVQLKVVPLKVLGLDMVNTEDWPEQILLVVGATLTVGIIFTFTGTLATPELHVP